MVACWVLLVWIWVSAFVKVAKVIGGIYLCIRQRYVVGNGLVGTQSVEVERHFFLFVRGFALMVTAFIGNA